MKTHIALDDRGFPILLQEPGVDVASTKSGNPAHIPAGQPGGGRFGKRTVIEKAVTQRGTAGVTQEEIDRRLDAVREAAREFEQWTAQDAREWLKGRITRPFTQAEVDAFLADVRSQQLADLVDALDQAERGTKRGRRTVRVVMPKGYRRKVLGALTAPELQQVVVRLKARGWTAPQLKRLSARLPVPKDGGAVDALAVEPVFREEPDPLQQPIYVQVPEQEPRTKIIHRDKRGLITRVEER